MKWNEKRIVCSYRIFFEIASFIPDIQGTSTDTRLDSCNLHSVTDIHRMESIYIYLYVFIYSYCIYILTVYNMNRMYIYIYISTSHWP